MSWRFGTATVAALSLVILPLSISSASADDTASGSPSTTPSTTQSATPTATESASSLPESTDSATPSATASSTETSSTAAETSASKTIIVTFDKAQSDPAQAAEAAVAEVADQVADAQVTKVAPITDSMVAVTLDSTLTATETTKVENQVTDAKGVKAAETAGLFQPTTTNDTYYSRLWNLNSSGTYGVHAEDAWSTSTGDGAVVGVIDTGITAHPDLTDSTTAVVGGNVIAGYDFISNACVAGDGGACVAGDGGDSDRDSNPTDPGDYTSSEDSSWHGTHVAGIVAALANNGIGVAGVAPDAKVEPLRALGHGGGEEQDVIAAIYLGAGLAVSGLPTNSQPADVLNLSLGMSGSCSTAMQTAINAATANGVVVVAAAGNDDLPVSTSSPANCNNVISVGATGPQGVRASYSNYGDSTKALTISAPGGANSVSYSDDILSTLNSGSTTAATAAYGYMAGTSMAAPHVSGIVALLKSLDPTLSTSQVAAVLKGTAKSGCSKPACGAGIAQADASVSTLSSNIEAAALASAQSASTFAITGTTRVGNTLSAGAASTLLAASYSYQWYRDDSAISGATGSSFTLTSADLGKRIRVSVAGSLANYSWSASSEATAKIAAGVFAKSSSPKASGTFKKGKTVTASKGTWSPSPSTYSYRWLRNGKSISGATKYKYKLTSKDRGKKISVRVTVTKSGYTTTSATSSTHTVKR